MNNLMLHCGASAVERQVIGQVEMPEPTDSHFPIPHDTFVDLVEDRLANMGFRFGEQVHSLTADGARYFGMAELLYAERSDVYSLTVGMRSSHDKSFAAGIAFGSRVFVCDNLAFTGEIKVARKHTRFIMRDLPALVGNAVASVDSLKQNQELRFETYQQRRIPDRLADHLIVQMLRNGVINTSRVEKVVNEWDEPSHDFGGRTAWRLFNAVTEALKGAPLHSIPARTIGLQSLIDSAVGFTPVIEGEAQRVQ